MEGESEGDIVRGTWKLADNQIVTTNTVEGEDKSVSIATTVLSLDQSTLMHKAIEIKTISKKVADEEIKKLHKKQIGHRQAMCNPGSQATFLPSLVQLGIEQMANE
ncbi:MAG: hypothetical protein I3J02_00810 [Prevotella sp.]|nr:hypothetical protein [Prevotella sp.]